jgi:hypothetical protein
MTQPATLIRGPSEGVAPEASAGHEPWSARVFWVAVVAALPAILWWGRDHWFYFDEWQVLGAEGSAIPGYLEGHNGHWSTLVRLDYQLNFALWGLRTYLPYQLPAVLSHLVVAVLVRQVARRCGARGWIATAAGLALLVFGSGRTNITFGFQVSLTGSLVCGFALLLLTDGPATVTKRDWLALPVGVVGLMTSSVFVPMLVGLGVASLMRRGARVAMFHVVPLVAIYTAWYVRYGDETAPPLRLTGRALRYAARLVWTTPHDLAQGITGALLLVVAAVGLAAAVYRARRSARWAAAALPLGVAASWVTFAGLTAVARAETAVAPGTPGRFLHISAALLLPLIALGSEELARRRALLGAAALVPLVIGLPGNLDELAHTSPLFRLNRELVSAIAHSAVIDDVPGTVRPLQVGGAFEPPATAAWLSRQAAAGRIPEPDPSTPPALNLTATSRLVLVQDHLDPLDQRTCPQLVGPLTVTLEDGDRLPFSGAITVRVTDGTHESRPRPFASIYGAAVRAVAGPVDVIVEAGGPGPPRVCAPPS